MTQMKESQTATELAQQALAVYDSLLTNGKSTEKTLGNLLLFESMDGYSTFVPTMKQIRAVRFMHDIVVIAASQAVSGCLELSLIEEMAPIVDEELGLESVVDALDVAREMGNVRIESCNEGAQRCVHFTG